ncbi:MAG: RimK family alpha-L-glutamate ligase [Clostridiales bacterium]|nr:RimK family alpha-L-glutamate ligase [Clostridiales bacterium]
MKGLIVVNAYAKTTETRQVVRMREELLKLGINTDTVRNDLFFARVLSSDKIYSRLDGYDFCLYLDKDKYASFALEKHMRLFNSASAIENCDDKMTTHLLLSDSGIPMPNTVAGLLCYDKSATVSDDAVNMVVDTLGLPVVVKQAYGSMGTGVFKADDFAQLKSLMQRFMCEPHLFQKYIASSCGKDLRVIVVGGKVLGGIQRSSDNDFRSNIGLGGTAVKSDVPDVVQEYAVKAAELLGLDYCGIDFLYGEKPLLCEVNSNAFFDAFEQATGINVAGAYARHIAQVIDTSQKK